MKVIYAIPTANPTQAEKIFSAWVACGYDTAALINEPAEIPSAHHIFNVEEYKGYPWAVNYLCAHLTGYDILVTGGDDTYPDRRYNAQYLARRFVDHFGSTMGVMQPQGDHFGRMDVCQHPWLGAEFIKAFGNKPYREEYYHYFCDAALFEDAKELGVLWCPTDIKQFHAQWQRTNQECPEYIKPALARWDADERIFCENYPWRCTRAKRRQHNISSTREPAR